VVSSISAITQSAADACTDLLRREILSGDYDGGHAFVIDQIAARIGVSHTPVREAVRRLEAEGLLTFEARRGARIRPMSPAEFEELFAIRKALEPIALEKSITKAVADSVWSVEFGFQQWTKATGSSEMLKAQWSFFRAMYAMSGLVRTLEAIDNNWRLIERFHRHSWSTSNAVRQKDYALKKAILVGFSARDIEGSLQALDECIEWGASLVRARLGDSAS
jgi:DNA-binding GntR family transcriptional regulator